MPPSSDDVRIQTFLHDDINSFNNLVLGGRRESPCVLRRRGKSHLKFCRLPFSEYVLV